MLGAKYDTTTVSEALNGGQDSVTATSTPVSEAPDERHDKIVPEDGRAVYHQHGNNAD
jgi:hypothetical protein